MRASNNTASVERRLWEIARAQHGVFSRKQALDAGLTRSAIGRRLEKGAWATPLRGVYRLAATPETWHQTLMAACLRAGDDAVVSHATAGQLWRLEGFGVNARSAPIELTLAFGKQRHAPGVVIHRSRKLGPADCTTRDGIPVTQLARTIVDLSAVLDKKHLSMALDSGLALHDSLDSGSLRRSLRRVGRKGRGGVRKLVELVDERDPRAKPLDSTLERRFKAALKAAGLSRPEEHFDVVEAGRHLAELDFAYPRARLGIQTDGAGVHRQHAVWERDQVQQSELAAAGWRVVHVTWAQMQTDEAAVVERIRRALAFGDAKR
jgi:Transcriptional regulator, AbiEi antitoxin